MLWFNLILGSNFILLCFKLINYNNQKQKKVKFEPRIKLNHNSNYFLFPCNLDSGVILGRN